MREKKVDRFFLIVVLTLVIFGAAMFVSASLGVLGQNSQLPLNESIFHSKLFLSILFSQLVLGLGCGLVGMYLCLKINYKFWRKYAFFIFLAAMLLTAAVFIPHLGWSHGGAQRWIKLGPVSFQPVEILKFAFVIYFASWLSWAKNRSQNFRYKILPFGIILILIGAILLNQPDTKSFILIVVTGIAMLFVSDVPFKYILGLVAGTALILGALIFFTPYLQERVKTFIDPSNDPQGSSYQIQQSLIALGSGKLFGRGYGQSIQKFSYLPEPQGDSIFAVLGEEFGFVGVFGTIFLYLLFALRGFRIANNSQDHFSRLLVSGIVILITVQSFMHIASNTGVFPLTGVPLPFMSHGGTSLMIYLSAMGIVLQISKFNKV